MQQLPIHQSQPISPIRKLLWLIKKPGVVYIFHRLIDAFQKKTGLLALKFPTHIKSTYHFPVSQWKTEKGKFLIESKQDIQISPDPIAVDEHTIHNIQNGKLKFFNGNTICVDSAEKWLRHPVSKKRYDASLHWTKISDFSESDGDIKYIWEPARFCYLYDIMRYDHHTASDFSNVVWDEIISWIDANPLNRGPHYISSQEIALRVLNWIYALHFYSGAQSLTDEVFTKIANSIHEQTMHIYTDRHFAKRFVRNNHVLTEALCLFTVGIVFPQFKESEKWKSYGHQTFCNEILYQFAEDGSYLQHSFNYQRVAMQLATWFLGLCNQNKVLADGEIHKRLTMSLEFMHAFLQEDGSIPNFGSNDGSLFFPLNKNDFINYKPQLQALAHALGYECYHKFYEDTYWMNVRTFATKSLPIQSDVMRQFTYEGYYILREDESFTFLWCPHLHHRPGQADMLHLEIWQNEKNILRDTGTWSYHSLPPAGNFFSGSAAHNTLLCNNESSLTKGGRFIFYNWPRKQNAYLAETDHGYEMYASMQVKYGNTKYRTVSRKVLKQKGNNTWQVTDTMPVNPSETMTQVWNICDDFFDSFSMQAFDKNGNAVEAEIYESWYAPVYGVLQPAKQIRFTTAGNLIKTTIAKN